MTATPGAGASRWLTLVVGGARSGKSAVAESIALASPEPVVYVATMCTGDDADLADRVALHRQRRPADWQTIEAGRDLAGALTSLPGTVLIDSLGPWVASHGDDEVDAARLCAALVDRPGTTVIVSEEVGSSVHPESAAGRRFRDELGRVNQAVAGVCDDVWLVVAGRVVPLARWQPTAR